jgi:membrane associated rhomboid family serine protease
MDSWVIACIVVIIATTAYSYYRQVSYSIVVSAACVAVFAIVVVASDTRYLTSSTVFGELAFVPRDIVHADRAYTVLTSMFTHVSPGHLIFNVLGLAFLGTMFEQKVGTRPFMVIYIIAGVCGTLMFAALRWNDWVGVVGASGAVSGVLGAFARMFPNERVAFLLMPTFPMPIWVFVLGYVGLQLLIVMGDTNIAVEAHIGGLVAGMLVAPYIVRLPLHRRVRRMISLNALRRLAKTPELKAMLRQIEEEEIADVRSAWIEEFLSRARCPHCGASLKVTRETITCSRGHLL